MFEEFQSIEVPLRNGGFTAIDIQDAARVLQYHWVGITCGMRYSVRYAISSERIGGKRVLLHRFLVNTPNHIDHKDGDSLNNRRSNLRPATNSQNQANRGVQRNNKLGVKGVYRNPRGCGYVSCIKVTGRTISLGTFPTIEAASVAYKTAARKYFGEFAHV